MIDRRDLTLKIVKECHFIHMRVGRPSLHIHAKWITWCDKTNSQLEFYELDKKGKLTMPGVQVHHIRSLGASPVLRPILKEVTYSIKLVESEVALPVTSGNVENLVGGEDDGLSLDWPFDFGADFSMD
jgi:hypothetical protein